MRKPTTISHTKEKILYTIVGIFLLGYFLTLIIRAFTSSLFVQHNDRTHLIIYGSTTRFYSLAHDNTRNYVLYYPADLKVQLPGGYGTYRIGSLNKLVSLDKKPDLFRKSFSLITSSFIDGYFYPESEEVYYGTEQPDKLQKPTTSELLFMKSNLSFLDRIYLILFFANAKDDQFRLLKYSDVYKVQDDIFFLQDEFIKKNIGLFYQKTYRNEQKNIQIFFKDEYATAERISSMLEGSGIRVSDITYSNKAVTQCIVTESGDSFSQTAQDIARFFNCTLEKGETDVYDIIFTLGSIEKEWEVNFNTNYQ